MKKNHAHAIAGSIYANYIIQSIAVIVVMQFSFVLTQQFDTTIEGLGKIASGIGMGKILFMFVSGLLSDRYGRKPFILIGMLCYVLFFVGLIFCTNIHLAFLLAVLAGAGNAGLDTGSMPVLTECFPQSAGSASILIKAFISIGSFILPFIVTYVYDYQVWYGWIFLAFAIYMLINMLFLLPKSFPSTAIVISPVNNGMKDNGSYFIGKPKLSVEGILLVLMGFTTSATFVVIMQWMPEIAKHAVSMAETDAQQLISYYSLGSIISVFSMAYIVKKWLKPIQCVIILPLLSSIILIIFLLDMTPFMCRFTAFTMGFTAAGGVLQLALVVMQQLFPSRKGGAVGVMYTLSGLAFVVTPNVVPKLAMIDVRYAIIFDLIMALLSVIFALIVYSRFKKVIDMQKI